MKVLLLSTGGRIGGEETFTKNLALALEKRGHFVIVCPGGEIQKADLLKCGIKICDVDITSRKPLGIYKAAKKIQEFAIQNSIDVIHAQSIGPALMGVIAKKIFKCKIPWIWHNHGITDFAYKYVVRHLDALDLVISNSDYVYVMLRNHGISLAKSKRIHNGIDISKFEVTVEEKELNRRKLVSEFNIPIGNSVVTYIGRFSPEKGVDVLLSAFKQLYEKRKDISCLLVGDGIEKDKFLNFAKTNSCGANIYFAGFRSDIKEILSMSDILILPSHIETFSLTTLQAFAVGTPVIASDVGGTPEQVLSKFNGLLFKDNDIMDLTDKIQYLLSNRKIAYRYSCNAKSLSDSYLNDDRMIDEIEYEYKKLIQGK